MNQEQQSRESPTNWPVLWVVGSLLALFAVTSVFGYVYEWRWTGFVEDTTFHKRTLWEWLELLIIPLAIGAGTVWFNSTQRQREVRDAERQRILELDIQNQRAEDDALQSYLDYMSKMILENKLLLPYMTQSYTEYIEQLSTENRTDDTREEPLSKEDKDFLDLLQAGLRARTLAVLSRLGEPWRKVSVLQFLGESGLITKAKLDHSTAVPLNGADLQGIDLSGPESYLDDTDLAHAILHKANFSGASLKGVYLNGAHLNGAYLNRANMADAYLVGADLTGADLTGADLTGVTGITKEQLEQAKSLEDATMPKWGEAPLTVQKDD